MTGRGRGPWAGLRSLRRQGLSGAGVGIGHLDSGVDAEHRALAGRIAAYRFFDHHGRALPRRRPFDDDGHGTHTAGLIVGDGISERLGIAPRARLHVAHVLEHGRVIARALRGLEWLTHAPIRVLAMPFGVPGDTPVFRPLLEALRREDVLVVAPIGNLGRGRYHAPAGGGGVLSVGAVDDRGRVPAFVGSKVCDGEPLAPALLAPGVDLESAEAGGGLDRRSGTSMAAAFVAGVAALLREAHPEATAARVEAALLATARPLSKGRRLRARAGIIDPQAALADLSAGNRTTSPEPWLAEPSSGRIDPRLRQLMRWAAPSERVPAVVLVDELRGARARALVEEVGRSTSRARRVRVLEPGGVVLLEARPSLLEALAEREETLYLSAQDVELSPYGQ